MILRILPAVLVLLASVAPLTAQRRIPQEKIPGRWGTDRISFALTNPGDGTPISASDQQALAAAFARVAALIRAAPPLNPPVGVEAMLVADPADWLTERRYKGPLPLRTGAFRRLTSSKGSSTKSSAG